uniref:WKF domain-containing protein n=1 Tax=Sus scrofa TaxID=9823 RepID=A0A8D0Q3K7_PIG
MAKQKRKDAGVTEKKSKKLKTSAREMPPAPAAPVATDEVQGAVSPEEQRVLDRKLKKERKKEARRLLREAGIPAAQSPPARPSGAELALDYLCGWAQKREDWRFQKTRQTWLLVHMYDRDQVGVLGRGAPSGLRSPSGGVGRPHPAQWPGRPAPLRLASLYPRPLGPAAQLLPRPVPLEAQPRLGLQRGRGRGPRPSLRRRSPGSGGTRLGWGRNPAGFARWPDSEPRRLRMWQHRRKPWRPGGVWG